MSRNHWTLQETVNDQLYREVALQGLVRHARELTLDYLMCTTFLQSS